MAAVSKKSTKRSRQAKKSSSSASTARTLLDEAEKTGDALLHSVKENFETLTHRISTAAGTAANTAASVTETHLGSEIAEFVSSAMNHVREASDATAHAISEGFDVLQQRVKASAAPAKKPRGRKKSTAAKKKAGKKKAGKKKVTVKKKAKKKAAKKKAAKKKTTAKKTAKKKTVAKKRKKAGR